MNPETAHWGEASAAWRQANCPGPAGDETGDRQHRAEDTSLDVLRRAMLPDADGVAPAAYEFGGNRV